MAEENSRKNIKDNVVEVGTRYLECKFASGTFTKDANKGNAPKASDIIKKIKQQTTNEGSE